MLSILSSLWPVVAGVVLSCIGGVYAFFHKQKADTAAAAKEAAETERDAAKERERAAVADAALAQQALDAVQSAQTSRAATDAAVAALKPGEAQAALINEGYTRG
ncbi:hypothetical protein [Chitinasiproducens palmae]|uniref:Uncharacterized protein n=1 Tax=Chitinasiproducens palmae TaxID=1770053 RepID=A0A1H2PS99_9BURK|nr:hypothetical protein [Chitinasiproducens palmae]SDV49839.1 hypothetical protein SAMN05216551_109181 [Chitinasiproducens palmae]